MSLLSNEYQHGMLYVSCLCFQYHFTSKNTQKIKVTLPGKANGRCSKPSSMCYGRGKRHNISNKHTLDEPSLESKIFVVFGVGLCFMAIFKKIRLFAGLWNFGDRTKMGSYSGLNRFGPHCIDHGGSQKPSTMSAGREHRGPDNGSIFSVQGWIVCTEYPLWKEL